MRINFLILTTFIFLIYSSYVYAEEECTFDKYLEVSGDFVKFNCITKDITAKEKTNIMIRTRDNGIFISPLPIDGKYLPMDFKEISKDPLIYKLNQSNDTAHYAFQLNVPGVNFWLLNVFYINSKEWYLTYGTKTPPTPPPKNRHPEWVCQNEYIINRTTTINLSKCFIDKDNDALTYSVTNAKNFQIPIEYGIAEIEPQDSFVGNETIVFHAYDGELQADKKVILIAPKKPQPPINFLDNIKLFLNKTRNKLIEKIWDWWIIIVIGIIIIILLIIIRGPKQTWKFLSGVEWYKKLKNVVIFLGIVSKKIKKSKSKKTKSKH